MRHFAQCFSQVAQHVTLLSPHVSRGVRRRRSLSVATLFLLTVLLVGCGGGGGPARITSISGMGSISGNITIETLSAGLEAGSAIHVYLKEDPARSAVTTSLGTYTIPSVPVGTYTVVVAVPSPPAGAVYMVQPAGGQSVGVQVFSGLSTLKVDFKLEAVPAPPW